MDSTSTSKHFNKYHEVALPDNHAPLWRHLTLGDYSQAHKDVSQAKHVIPTTSGVHVRRTNDARLWPSNASKLQALAYTYAVPAAITFDASYQQTKPIVIKSLLSGQATALSRTTINVEAANVALELSFRMLPPYPRVVATATAVYARRNTNVTLLAPLHSHRNTDQFHHLSIYCDENAQVTVIPLVLGAGFTRLELQVELCGPGASAEVIGVDNAQNDAQHSIITHQIHSTPHARSMVEVRTIIHDVSKAIYHGLISIAPGANGSNAYQKNSNLLLSTSAKAHTTPKLEIQANDVRCTHGATSSPLDPEHLFYLACRGIDERKSIQLLTKAFASSSLARIADIGLRRRAKALVQKAITHG